MTKDYYWIGVQENIGMINIMESHGIFLSDGEIKVIWKKHDVQDKGRINYADFLKQFVLTSKPLDSATTGRAKFYPPSTLKSFSPETDQLLELMTRIRQDISDNWKAMRRSFRALDKDGSGSCKNVEFKQMLRHYKIDLNEEEFYHLITYFDLQMTGKIQYNDFLRVLLT